MNFKFQNSQWFPIYILTISAFVMNTNEFSPIGLITEIAETYQLSISTAGHLITLYAWVVALGSIPMVMLTAKMNRRILILVVFFCFSILQFICAAAPSFDMLLTARVGGALFHTLFWAIAPPLAFKLAPIGKKSKAIGMMTIGTSLALILGLPFGTYLGQLFGWRTTFSLIGLTMLLLFFVLWFYLPSSPSQNTVLTKAFGSIIKSKVLWVYYPCIRASFYC